jgi:hypothetical protein
MTAIASKGTGEGDRLKGVTTEAVSQHSRQLSAGLRKAKMVNAQTK